MANEWLKKRRKKMLAHGLILTVFCVYLVFLAEPLFDRFEAMPGEARLMEISMMPSETNNIRYNIEVIQIRPEAMQFSGWAFVEEEGFDCDKVYLVLKSDRDSYVFETSPFRRADVAVDYENLSKKLSLNLETSGFETTIPTRKIENGEYVVGLYATVASREALQYTDKAIAKSKGLVNETMRMSSEEQIALPAETKDLKLSVDSIKEVSTNKEEGYVEIEGWAFIEDQDSRGNNIYFVLRSNDSTYVFDTILVFRPDVTAAFVKSALNLDYSGFTARIPETNIQRGTYELGICVKKGEAEVLQYTDRKIMLRDDGLVNVIFLDEDSVLFHCYAEF